MNAHLVLNIIIHLVIVYMKQMSASLCINWHFKSPDESKAIQNYSLLEKADGQNRQYFEKILNIIHPISLTAFILE